MAFTCARAAGFFFNNTATPEIYTLSLHDALPISRERPACSSRRGGAACLSWLRPSAGDRKSTRLNSSHRCISYAVFCLKKKKNQGQIHASIREITTRPVTQGHGAAQSWGRATSHA